MERFPFRKVVVDDILYMPESISSPPRHVRGAEHLCRNVYLQMILFRVRQTILFLADVDKALVRDKHRRTLVVGWKNVIGSGWDLLSAFNAQPIAQIPPS